MVRKRTQPKKMNSTKSNGDDLSQLGGIFTVDNGWDQQKEKEAEKSQIQQRNEQRELERIKNQRMLKEMEDKMNDNIEDELFAHEAFINYELDDGFDPIPGLDDVEMKTEAEEEFVVKETAHVQSSPKIQKTNSDEKLDAAVDKMQSEVTKETSMETVMEAGESGESSKKTANVSEMLNVNDQCGNSADDQLDQTQSESQTVQTRDEDLQDVNELTESSTVKQPQLEKMVTGGNDDATADENLEKTDNQAVKMDSEETADIIKIATSSPKNPVLASTAISSFDELVKETCGDFDQTEDDGIEPPKKIDVASDTNNNDETAEPSPDDMKKQAGVPQDVEMKEVSETHQSVSKKEDEVLKDDSILQDADAVNESKFSDSGDERSRDSEKPEDDSVDEKLKTSAKFRRSYDDDILDLGQDDELDFEFSDEDEKSSSVKPKVEVEKKLEVSVQPVKPIPAAYTSELDELKIKFVKETPKPAVVQPTTSAAADIIPNPEEARRQFEENSRKIALQGKDLEHEMKLKNIFPNVCINLLRGGICHQFCKNRHMLPEREEMSIKIAYKKTPEEITDMFQTISSNALLFKTYLSLMLETFITKKMKSEVAMLIRTSKNLKHEPNYYKIIHESLTEFVETLDEVGSLRFILRLLGDGEDYIKAEGAIVDLIFSLNDDSALTFLDFFEDMALLKPIPDAYISIMLCLHGKTKDEALNLFLLKQLVKMDNYFEIMNKDLINFFSHQTMLTMKHNERAALMDEVNKIAMKTSAM